MNIVPWLFSLFLSWLFNLLSPDYSAYFPWLFKLFFPDYSAYFPLIISIISPDRQQMTLWRMRITCWTPKATNTHSQYVILITFPLQQWLHECASLLRHTNIACLVSVSCWWRRHAFSYANQPHYFPGAAPNPPLFSRCCPQPTTNFFHSLSNFAHTLYCPKSKLLLQEIPCTYRPFPSLDQAKQENAFPIYDDSFYTKSA